MPKQIMTALILVLLFCACPSSATSDLLLHPTCSNICRGFARDDLNYRYCAIACKEAASTNKVNLDNVGDSYNPSELPDYFQNGERVPVEKNSESKTIDYNHNPVEDSQRVGEGYETWSPSAGSVSKRSSPTIWRKVAESEPPHDQGMSFIRIGRPTFLLGKLPVSEVQRRASSFVRIGRAPYPVDRGQGEAFIQELRKTIEAGEAGSDPTMELEGNRPNFDFESGKPLMVEHEGKRASSFVRIGRSYADSNSNRREQGSFYSMNNDAGDKRASSFVRIGRSLLDDGEMRARSFLEMGKSANEVESMPRSVNRVRKSLTENDKKRASSFVRIGKSSLNEEEKRASSFVRIGKSHIDEVDKRASSFVRIGKSPSFEDEKRASSFVRIGKSPLDEDAKRASSFVRIGKSPSYEDIKRASSFVRIGKSHLDEADKRASSFVRIGKSPTNEEEKRASSFVRIGKSHLDEVEKRASSFVRIGKSHLDEVEKRASSFVRIGKSPTNEEEKRASSFVRIGKSHLDEAEKRASSFVRIGKSPSYEDSKRASSFVRIGKSMLDEDNESTSLAEIGKPSPSAHKRSAGSLLRNKKRPFGYESEKLAGSSTVGAGSSAEPDSDEFQMNEHDHEDKRYSAYWRLRIPSSRKEDDTNESSLLRIPRPVVESILDQDSKATHLLPGQKTDQVLWIPVTEV